MEEVVSRRSGLISINNDDEKCLLYCIAGTFTCNTNMYLFKNTDHHQYIDFVNLIKISDNKFTVQLPISLNDITELERINRKGINDIPFRINVFLEDLLLRKLFLIRASPYNDGKFINVLLTEFTVGDKDYWHYVLIKNTTFFKKRYVSKK